MIDLITEAHRFQVFCKKPNQDTTLDRVHFAPLLTVAILPPFYNETIDREEHRH